LPAPPSFVNHPRFARIDVLLLLMTLIWGTNYAIVKHAFTEMDPQAFNALRMIVASSVFLVMMLMVRRRRAARAEPAPTIFYTPHAMTGRELLMLGALGVVGQTLYQYLFIAGLARTSIANSAVIAAAAPVMIALVSGALGEERLGRGHWLGAALSLLGIYIVVGPGVKIGGSSLAGDLLMLAAMACWSAYTLGARPLMARHSPVAVTGISMAVGTLFYVPAVASHVAALDWSAVSPMTWVALVYSAVFSLSLSYTIWYSGVRAIGSARTSVYSNLVPIFAMVTAIVFLGEPVNLRKIAGAAAVLIGVALTRLPTLQPAPEA
jgi:drug/metabolite transporter (DMT)-like permease